MMQTLTQFIHQIENDPETIAFQDVIKQIDANYHYTPTRFINGKNEDSVTNLAGENTGSCKIFSFAKIHGLDKTKTLHCFGQYYRQDVLQHPDNTDHANIRSFIKYGWGNICFDNAALVLKEG